jgi:hypothetical protein
MKMKFWTALLFFFSVSTMNPPSGSASEPSVPRIGILLDPTVHSESVDIRYKMVGDFGVYYSFVRPQQAVRRYLIPASLENKPAREMTVVVYATGCQFQAFQFDLTVSEPPVNRQFECQPLSTVGLTGYMDPRELPSDRPLAIVAELEADWLCALFQLMDCLVPSIKLGQVGSIDAGRDNFEVSIPDFFADPVVNAVVSATADPGRVGTLILVLRNKFGQTVAAIRPKESTPENPQITVQREYQSLILFEKVRQAAAQHSAAK